MTEIVLRVHESEYKKWSKGFPFIEYHLSLQDGQIFEELWKMLLKYKKHIDESEYIPGLGYWVNVKDTDSGRFFNVQLEIDQFLKFIIGLPKDKDNFGYLITLIKKFLRLYNIEYLF